jgi:hypothetical protein
MLVSEKEDSPGLRFVEAHEMFVEHIEAGRTRLRVLSVVTIVVAFLLLASYFSQLLLPFTSGTRYVQLDLLSPAVVILQTFLVVVIFAWLYIGIVNYIFASRLGSLIREGRLLERQLEKKAFSSEESMEALLPTRSPDSVAEANGRRVMRKETVHEQGEAASSLSGPVDGQPREERLILMPKDPQPSEVVASKRQRGDSEAGPSAKEGKARKEE